MHQQIPSHLQQIQIAAIAHHSASTVARAYRGGRVHEGTRIRIARAAQELGLPPPPAATGAGPEQAA